MAETIPTVASRSDTKTTNGSDFTDT
jgi:hypothetical protein